MSQGQQEGDDAPDPRWAHATTLRHLGALVAEWLDGRMGSSPFYGGMPDPETKSITPILQQVNRSGFVTDFSQPGALDGEDAQHAAVISQPAGVDGCFQLPISRAHDCTFTILAGDHAPLSSDDDEWPWPGIHPELRAQLLNAWHVSVCDPLWGRDDALWPALVAAMGYSVNGVRGSLIDPDYLESQGLASYG